MIATIETQELFSTEVIYFFEQPGDGIYIGTTTNWPARRAHHVGAGRIFLGIMRAPAIFEARLHSRSFASSRISIVGNASVHATGAVLPYLEWLVRIGLASTDEADLPHLPDLPWEAIDPARMAAGDACQLRLLDRGPTGSVRDRLRRSTKFACWSSKSSEWYTPPAVIEAARAAMGGIDLDPASCPNANRVVQATAFYSERQDGLTHPWSGRVWLNPPYEGKAEAFVARLLDFYRCGQVSQGIALLSSQAPTTMWADPFVRAACAVGISRGKRWEFRPGNGQVVTGPAGGSAVLYFGDRVTEFARAFDGLAHVLLPSWTK